MWRQFANNPHLPHGDDEHDAKAATHAGAGANNHQGKIVVNFCEEPGNNIGTDGYEWNNDNDRLQPFTAEIGMGKYKSDNKENECQAK